MFGNKQVEAIARILAVTILLDQRQREQEMVEFCHYLMKINQDLNPDNIMPRPKILTWFKNNKVEFADAIAGDTDGSFKIEVLKPITDPELRKKVLTAVFAVSISDHEFHAEEMEFIKIALETWKSDMPTLKDVSKIAD